ncbi:MAG: alpha-L-fucosidase [Armatimonadota bacterium]
MGLDVIKTDGDTSWFVRDRFGLFIHWGIYALPARHEWVKHNESISDAEYDKYFKHFDPDLCDPELWAKAASQAGMKYFVVTTKHHDGFCLWDSKLTEYKSTNTPCGRDLLRPMVDAFRDRGLRTGFYHSLIDWHHPDFVVDDVHSLRKVPNRAELNKDRDQSRYVEYLHGQVREILTDFGKVDIMWFDWSYPERLDFLALSPDSWHGKGREDWGSEELLKLVRSLMPNIILNDRLDLDCGWDVKTPEQIQPREWVKFNGQPVVWEACQTFSGSWGYHRDEATWKSIDQLIQMLVDTVSKGGNLLLNIGPTGRGEIDERALDRLKSIGEWMQRHSRSIYGCTQAPSEFVAPKDCRLTYNPDTNRMYVHVFAWPFMHLHIDGFAGKVEYAQLLNDASEVKIETLPAWQKIHAGLTEDTLTLNLPVVKPSVTVPVIELFLK